MSAEHYFSETPATEFKAREIEISLDGQRVRVTTAGGVFSPEHLDTGTAVLLEHLDEVPAGGNILDIGCGWGPIALAIAARSPKATVWAIDVNDRSRQLTETNARRLGLSNIKVCAPDEIPADVRFSGIWSNPPIRVGKAELHGILLRWLPRLAESGEAWLVVQKNLGADSLLRWMQAELPQDLVSDRVDSSKTFRVLRVRNRA